MTDIRVHLPSRPAPSGSTDWRDRAACRDADPELFFPIGNAGPALHQVDQAKQVCARCTVRTPCLEWALASGQEAGVWGGTSDDERRALRRMRQAGAQADADADATDCRSGDLDSKPKRHDRLAGRENVNEAVT
jgi:WhiB family transcriptional regulator, redox-sensing transcriptional regulator